MMDVSQPELSAACKSEHMDTSMENLQLDMERSHLGSQFLGGEFAQCVILSLLFTGHGATATWSPILVTSNSALSKLSLLWKTPYDPRYWHGTVHEGWSQPGFGVSLVCVLEQPLGHPWGVSPMFRLGC